MIATLPFPELKNAVAQHPLHREDLLPNEIEEAMLQARPDALSKYYAKINEAIILEKENPAVFGFEPEIWKKADAAIVDLRKRFPKGVLTELDLGGNRASKSERAAKRMVENMIAHPGWKCWALQSNETSSRQNQQSIIYKYLPPEWKPESGKLRQGSVTKIVYTQAGGFTENVLVCPNGSECRFKFYGMNVGGVEGAELDEAWADELVPPDWIEALIFRLVTRNGLLRITFTPIEGYSATVKAYLDGAQTIEEVVAELLPKQVQFGNQETRKDGDVNCTAHAEPRSGTITGANCNGTKEPTQLSNGAVNVPPAAAPNETIPGLLASELTSSSEFEMVPRIQENLNAFINGQKSRAVIVYFHTADNPYGNYESMKETLAGASREKILTRAYGVPTKAMMPAFPMFNDKVHVISLQQFREIQRGGGSWIHLMDPCSGARNFFQLWIFADRRNRAFIAAESPSTQHSWRNESEIHADLMREHFYIPGEGDVGPWAIPGAKADGEKGDGQKELGWGYERYAQEIERIERLLNWSNEGRITVDSRWIDSSYANTKTTRSERSVTMIEEWAEHGIEFLAASRDVSINVSARGGGDSLRMINDRLFYDTTRPIDATNEPHLYVVETCPNTRQALAEWTGRDGQHGALKDPVDTVRMFVLSGSEYVDPEAMKPITPWSGSGAPKFNMRRIAA